jgi:hypothetical protein
MAQFLCPLIRAFPHCHLRRVVDGDAGCLDVGACDTRLSDASAL